MLKLLIADDEPKIRRGLRKSLAWEEFGIMIAGEAEDGEIALQMASNIKPDIMFVDICMPFLNGLELIEKLKEELPNCVIIIISGYDEFEYAQKAVKLKVFDYVLKPVDKKVLRKTVERAVQEFSQTKENNKYINWAKKQLKENKEDITKTFFQNWVKGQLNDQKIIEFIDFIKLDIEKMHGIFLIKPLEIVREESFELEPELLNFCIQNIIQEILEKYQPNIVFSSERDIITAIVPDIGEDWYHISEIFLKMINKFLYRECIVCQKKLSGKILDVPLTYIELLKEIDKKSSYTPIVMLAKSYIEKYYYKQDISLQEVADEVKISSAYLSRLVRKELGCTFKEYLTKVRIEKSIKFMNNPSMKIYEIAEQVGYNTQHYFSAAFKKVTGVSPNAYKSEKGLKH